MALIQEHMGQQSVTIHLLHRPTENLALEFVLFVWQDVIAIADTVLTQRIAEY